jgi:2-dehydro-3-deoxy-D-arabinonate dehydratase
MLLYKKDQQVWLLTQGKTFTRQLAWDELVNRAGLHHFLQADLSHWHEVDFLPELDFDPPIQSQEVWAAGVTYLRSMEARKEESKGAGGDSFYDRVYTAERPELFFKSQPYRVAGSGQGLRLRRDSSWNVPEPELTLFICTSGSIEGYTVGNDMSSRSIEGENPLYLPQAKTYEQSAGLGPCLYIPASPIDPNTRIHLRIDRGETTVFSQSIPISQMKRKHEELAAWLLRELYFPKGCYLMTGTGMVPPDHFTLQANDMVQISIDHIGTLTNKILP